MKLPEVYLLKKRGSPDQGKIAAMVICNINPLGLAPSGQKELKN
jgi:hypothetical protein